MYQQMYQTERYHLVTLQQNLQQELKQIDRIRQAEDHPHRTPILRQMLTAAGWRMVEIGTRLVERYSLSEYERQHPGTRAAGLT